MTNYVAGFLFSPDLYNVVLIEKEKPAWQKGKYNGIGGKIEEGESALEAMIREFQEEAGLKIETWHDLAFITGKDYTVQFFYSVSKDWDKAERQEGEDVFNIPVHDIHINVVRDKLIFNLHWLIPLAIDKHITYSGMISV